MENVLNELREKCNGGIVTHSGLFHADDVFSSAFIGIMFGKEFLFSKLCRVKSVPSDFTGLVFDIGGGEFDHHQAAAPVRQTGEKYAAFGKLWNKYGIPYLLSKPDVIDYKMASEIATMIDDNFIINIDLTDNFGQARYPNGISQWVYCCNDNNITSIKQDEKFFSTVITAITIFDTVINKYIAVVKRRYENIEKISSLKEDCLLAINNTDYIPIKDIIEIRPKILGLVSENPRGGYSLMLNTNEISLPEEIKGKGILFSNNFMVVFDTIENAVTYFRWLIENDDPNIIGSIE